MQRWTKVLWASSLAIVACASGCASKGDDADPGPKYPDVASYCQGRAEAACNGKVLEACAATGAEACVATNKADCIAESPSDRSYRADQAEGCVGSVASAYADAVIEPSEIEAMNEACGGLFELKSGLTGAACVRDADCRLSDGLACVLHADATAQTIAGTCATPRSVDKGDSCSAADAQCGDGYFCDTNAHCVAEGGTGAPCGPAQPCGKKDQCDASTNRCRAKAAAGESCTADGDCVSDMCNLSVSRCTANRLLSPAEPACNSFR